jgi:hypothetical protein
MRSIIRRWQISAHFPKLSRLRVKPFECHSWVKIAHYNANHLHYSFLNCSLELQSETSHNRLAELFLRLLLLKDQTRDRVEWREMEWSIAHRNEFIRDFCSITIAFPLGIDLLFGRSVWPIQSSMSSAPFSISAISTDDQFHKLWLINDKNVIQSYWIKLESLRCADQ